MTPSRGYYIYVTEACNLRCNYCFVKDKNNHRSMPWDVMHDVIKFIAHDLEGRSSKYIHFFGGEPLLNKQSIELIQDALEVTKPKGCKISYGITTNGTLLTEDICGFLKSRNIGVQLSLDGAEVGHNVHRKLMNKQGSFKKVRWANYLKYLGDNARMTITRSNMKYLTESVADLHRLGFKSFSTIPDPEDEWDDRSLYDLEVQFRALLEIRLNHKCCDKLVLSFLDNTIRDIMTKREPKTTCRAGRSVIGITVDGDIYPCHDFAGRFRTDPEKSRLLVIGNVKSGIKPESECMKIDAPIRSGAGYDCISCHARSICHRGCPYVNYTIEKDTKIVNRNYCRLTRMYADLAMEYVLRSDEYKIVTTREYLEINRRLQSIVDKLGANDGSDRDGNEKVRC